MFFQPCFVSMSERMWNLMKKLLLIAALCALPLAAMAETYYYNPDGGVKYHRDPQCATISQKYHDQMQPVEESQLTQSPYDLLKPCLFCMGRTEEAVQTEPVEISPYAAYMAPLVESTQGIGVTGAGEFRIGGALPAGMYTLHCADGAEDILITRASGEQQQVGRGGYYSMYLAEGDMVTLSELSLLSGIHTTMLFQEAKDYPIAFARWLAYVNMPGRQYTFTADADGAYVEIATPDEAQRCRIPLEKGRKLVVNLQPEKPEDAAWPSAWYEDTGEDVPLGFDADLHVFVEVRDVTVFFQQGLG